MPFPRLPRLTMRRVCLCTLLTTFLALISALVLATFYIALPTRRALYLELDFQQKHTYEARAQCPAPVPWGSESVEQLFHRAIPSFKTWDGELDLNFDGTATDSHPGLDMWIYLASTAPDSRQQPFAYEHMWKRHDCTDPAYICDMYIDAFQRVKKRWTQPRSLETIPTKRSRTMLRWVDCDISPGACSRFGGLGGLNMLVHVNIGYECDYRLHRYGSCPVTWRWIGLPMYQAPWTRQIRIPLGRGGSTVVPAFPSAEEQMWNIIAYEAAVDGVDYDKDESYPPRWNSMGTVSPPPPDDDALDAQASDSYLTTWTAIRHMLAYPWNVHEWPYEEIRCYVERYADMLLSWWDDAAHIVRPRECVGIEESRIQRKEDEEFWNEWRARDEEKTKKKWDKMMSEVMEDLKTYHARKEAQNE